MSEEDGTAQDGDPDPLAYLSDAELIESLRDRQHDRSWTVAQLISLEHRGYEILDDDVELRADIVETVEHTWSRIQASVKPLADSVASQLSAISRSPAFEKMRTDLERQMDALAEAPALKALAADMRATVAAADVGDHLREQHSLAVEAVRSKPLLYSVSREVAGPTSAVPTSLSIARSVAAASDTPEERAELSSVRLDSERYVTATIEEQTEVLVRIEQHLGAVVENTSDTADAAVVGVEHDVGASAQAEDDARRSRRVSWLSLLVSVGALVVALVALAR